jgi:hypothetical protein
VSAAPPTATPEPVPAAEPPAPALAAIPAPPSRHEALAVITALSDDEKIALFS